MILFIFAAAIAFLPMADIALGHWRRDRRRSCRVCRHAKRFHGRSGCVNGCPCRSFGDEDDGYGEGRLAPA